MRDDVRYTATWEVEAMLIIEDTRKNVFRKEHIQAAQYQIFLEVDLVKGSMA